MECNKEEAIRAKEIAMGKMQNKDYSGARRVALKAQQLYPDLENISQLILVCDVHLSAESTVNGNEKDWYGILKIESTADEALIKKQYRKFALLLHPDKNRFSGASDAFKLIGEAHRVLLDPNKRGVYDSKSKASIPPKQHPDIKTQPQPPASFSGFTKTTSGSFASFTRPTTTTTTSFTSFTTQQQQPQRPTQDTFWTMCPYCTIKYEYYRNVINKTFLCQKCNKSFTGYEIPGQATSNHAPRAHPPHGVFKPKDSGKVGSQRNVSSEPQRSESVTKKQASAVGRDYDVMPRSSAKVNGNRKRQTNTSSATAGSDIKSKSDKEVLAKENGDVEMTQNFGSSSGNVRKSGRHKTDISYEENASLSKRGKSNGSFHANKNPVSEEEASRCNLFKEEASPMPMDEDNLNKVKEEKTGKGNGGSTAMENEEKTSGGADNGISPDLSSDGTTVTGVYVIPDQDFHDFDKDRREDCFAVGQVWALYDPVDAMPRYYARIRKVDSPGFKLKIAWLEYDPDDEDEKKWVDAELPVACGKLRNGNSETINDRLMFSHQAVWEKGTKRDTYKIYPQKGETWALFKDWDINWYSDRKTKRKFQYEFVEILSDYFENNGVFVAYLGKLKGFSCLFCRTARAGVDSFLIPRNQLFRFSHRVPSFHLTGEEREGVPKNSLELDAASLPDNLVEIDIPEDPKADVKTVETSNGDSPLFNPEKKRESDSDGNSDCSVESLDCKVPAQEFHNFDGEKSPLKFQPGQCWALYSDEDGLPKYYAFIKKTVHLPSFKLEITWLDVYPSQTTIQYANKHLPIGCGIFKLDKGSSSSYAETSSFSHRLIAEPTGKKDLYAIYPRKAEVWAVYKNWNPKMTRSELRNCEYDIVEIVEENGFAFKVVSLELVNGHKSVFRARKDERATETIEIVREEILRFSHQIPAFPLTDERGGSLRGCMELDLAALPVRIFRGS